MRIMKWIAVMGWLVVAALGDAVAAADGDGDTDLRWKTGYTGALERASSRGRPVFVVFESAGCGWCRLMKRDVLTDKRIVEKLRRFECVRVDVEEDIETAMAFQVSSLPRTVLINSRRQVVGDHLGFLSVDALLAIMEGVELDLDRQVAEAPDAPGVVERVDVEEVIAQFAVSENGSALSGEWLARLGGRDRRTISRVLQALEGSQEQLRKELEKSLDHEYLAVRIGALEILEQLLGREVEFDPWAAREERRKMLQIATQRQQGKASEGS